MKIPRKEKPGRGTRPIGDGTVNITFNAPTEMRNHIDILSKKSGMNMGEYLREIVNKAINNNTLFGVVEITESPTPRKAK